MTNNVTLIGRLTKAIDIKATNSGTTVGNFTLAVNLTFGKKEQEADFITCVAFNKTAEIISQYTDKGSQIAVVGRIQTRNYENKEGVRIYVTEVVANQVQLLDSKAQITAHKDKTIIPIQMPMADKTNAHNPLKTPWRTIHSLIKTVRLTSRTQNFHFRSGLNATYHTVHP